jgi:hypothetical protein
MLYFSWLWRGEAINLKPLAAIPLPQERICLRRELSLNKAELRDGTRPSPDDII